MNLLRETTPQTSPRETPPDQAHPDAAQSGRTARVIRIKRQLQMGTYDEDAKIDAILDRLVADVLSHEDAPTPERREER